MTNEPAKTSIPLAVGRESSVQARPPIVAIMGHIDHGKSTLLDHIRESNIVAGEAGGITQRLSAYEAVHISEGRERRITFLDTPGHEAFQAMRSRGASAADIVILVVAADDGVKEQTLEALKAITDAKVPFVVAINKIDKPNANIDAVKQGLAEHGVFLEGYGGSVPFAAVSAKVGTGVGDLLDLVLLAAELEGLVGDESKNAEGIVIESHIDPKKGTSATLVVKDGVLRTGMFVVAGTSVAPTRIMEDFLGKRVGEVRFGSPVQVVGFNTAPPVGSPFRAVFSKKEAEELVTTPAPVSRRTEAHAEERSMIPIIIKADALGAVDAIVHEINKCSNEWIVPKIVATGVGDISENDVRFLGADTRGLVVGFNVKAAPSVREQAARDGVEIGIFDIIYRLTEWLTEQFATRTPKRESDERIGLVRIIKTFSRTKEKQIVGGEVVEGILTHGAKVKILRREAEIGRGKIVELQQQKVRAEKVEAGNQFGAQIEARIDIAPGDRLEAFETVIS